MIVRSDKVVGRAEVCTVITSLPDIVEEEHTAGSVQIDDDQVEATPMPDHLSDLYNRICKNVAPGDDRWRIKKMLLKFQNTFSKNKTDFGRTDVCELEVMSSINISAYHGLRCLAHVLDCGHGR